jgi:hypothetical protein
MYGRGARETRMTFHCSAMKTLDLYVYDKDGDNLPQGRGITYSSREQVPVRRQHRTWSLFEWAGDMKDR